MAKKGYTINKSGVAKRIKKMYLVNKDNIVKKAIKAYIIDKNGVARRFYIDTIPTKYSKTIADLTFITSKPGAASTKNHAIFAGGEKCWGYATGDSWDTANGACAYESGTFTQKSQLKSIYREKLGATSINGYALFGGGGVYGGSRYRDVYCYNDSLEQSMLDKLSVSRNYLAAVSNNKYALFAGGISDSGVVNTIDVYNKNLTKENIGITLNESVSHHGAVSSGEYMIFGGGSGKSKTLSVITVFDSNLSLIETVSALEKPRSILNAVTTDDFAVFGPGRNDDGGTHKVMDCYDNKTLTRTTVSTESIPITCDYGAVSLNGYGVFAGGSLYDYDTNGVYYIDNNLSVSKCSSTLREMKYGVSGTSLDNYIIFGGGAYRVDKQGFFAVKSIDVFKV